MEAKYKMKEKRWSLSENELAILMHDNLVETTPGSPLENIIITNRNQVEPKRSVQPDLLQAIKWVSQPRFEIGLLASPSNNNEIIRFFRGEQADSDALVGHRKDSKGDHLFACTSEQELMPLISACLMLDIPTDAGSLSLDLTTTAYQAFLGVIDFSREFIIKSLIEHKPASVQNFTAKDILDAFERSSSLEDIRWLASLVRAVSPIKFDLDITRCEQGLHELADQNLLVDNREGWALSPNMEAICTTLASPLAFCVIYRRHLVEHKLWNLQHLIALRGMGSLWLFKLEGLDSSNLWVHIRDASSEDVELAISEEFQEWEIPRTVAVPPAVSTKGTSGLVEPSQKPKKAVPDPGQMLCPSCGGLLKEGAKYCGFCQAQLVKEAPVSPPKMCPKCNNPLKPGKQFCGRCGFKIS